MKSAWLTAACLALVCSLCHANGIAVVEFKKGDLINYATGGTIMAAGGGGSFQISSQLIQTYVAAADSVNVVSWDTPGIAGTAAMVGAIGSPEAIFSMQSPFSLTKNVVQAYRDFEQADLKYIMPVETGALNGTFALVTAIGLNKDSGKSPAEGVAVMNMDGGGRSVPTLPLLYYASAPDVYPLYPAIIAQADDYKIGEKADWVVLSSSSTDTIESSIIDAISTSEAFVSPYRGLAGILMYPLDASKVAQNPPIANTVTQAQQVGSYYNAGAGTAVSAIVSYLTGQGRQAKPLISGTVVNMTESTAGLDKGQITIVDSARKNTLVINYENENICATLNGKPYIMAPDTIGYVPNPPPVLDNSDLHNAFKAGKRPTMVVLGIEADSKILKTSSLMDSWKPIRKGNDCPETFSQPWLQ